jgi:hypothetical protein
VDVSDDFLIKFLEIQAERLSFLGREVGVANVIVETAHSAEDSLVNTIRHSNISLELSVSSLSQNSNNNSIIGSHILTHLLKMVKIGIPLNIHP